MSNQDDRKGQPRTPKAFTSRESLLLLKNPNRGFRFEVSMDVSNGRVLHDRMIIQATIESLQSLIQDYEWESPGIAQMYFYLTEYVNRPLDDTAMANMRAVMEFIKEKRMTALPVFAYSYDQNHTDEPSTEQVMAHIAQLKDLFFTYRPQLHAIQAGFLGFWGEWGPCFCESSDTGLVENRKRIVQTLLDNTPEDLFVQVRYISIKQLIEKEDKRYPRVAFEDMFIGPDNPYSLGGNDPDSEDYKQAEAESPFLLNDCEMPWGQDTSAPWPDIYLSYADADPYICAKNIFRRHFTTMSVFHDYRECGPEQVFALKKWQNVPADAERLKTLGLPVPPGWFRTGGSMFDYIRDFIGYRIEVTEYRLTDTGDGILAEVALCNTGFAAPLGMKSGEFVLLRGNSILSTRKACKLSSLLTGKTVNCFAEFPKPNGEFRMGIRLINAAGDCARFASDLPFENGIHMLDE